MWIVSISLASPTFSSVNSFFFSYGQDINSTESDRPFLGINNAVGLSLIPLMIKEMENTNATTIPIKQVINATPSNATALQNISKNSTENNNTNTGDTNDGFKPVNDTAKELIPFATPSNATALQNISKNSTENNNTNTGDTNDGFKLVNDTAKELIPFVVNLTKNTNATDIAMARTINATPSNATALQNMTRDNTNDGFKPVNDTAKELIPFVVNLTKNTNATTIPIKQVFNATPSNATALQNISKNSTENNNANTGDTNDGFKPVNDTAKELIPFVNLTKNTNTQGLQ